MLREEFLLPALRLNGAMIKLARDFACGLSVRVSGASVCSLSGLGAMTASLERLLKITFTDLAGSGEHVAYLTPSTIMAEQQVRKMGVHIDESISRELVAQLRRQEVVGNLSDKYERAKLVSKEAGIVVGALLDYIDEITEKQLKVTAFSGFSVVALGGMKQLLSDYVVLSRGQTYGEFSPMLVRHELKKQLARDIVCSVGGTGELCSKRELISLAKRVSNLAEHSLYPAIYIDSITRYFHMDNLFDI